MDAPCKRDKTRYVRFAVIWYKLSSAGLRSTVVCWPRENGFEKCEKPNVRMNRRNAENAMERNKRAENGGKMYDHDEKRYDRSIILAVRPIVSSKLGRGFDIRRSNRT